MAKKGSCELCTKPARMFCESDQASLCWDCDEKVHSANFLVAKHSRTLLCHVCLSLTPWKADGLKLGPTVSVCYTCSSPGAAADAAAPVEEVSQESESDDGEYDSSTDTDTGSDTDFSDGEEDDGDNQVVPWTETADVVASSAAGSVSSLEEEMSLKRMLEDPSEYEDEDGCCSSQNSNSKICNIASNPVRSLESDEMRPLKMRRTSDGPLVSTEESNQMKSLKGTAAIVDRLRKLQQDGEGEASKEVVSEICKLARDA